MEIFNKKIVSSIPFLLLALGVMARLLYAGYFGFESEPQEYMNYSAGNKSYTHDLPSHIQYIQFIANNLSLPEVDKSLEYPQQPLYYLTMGIFYRMLERFLSSTEAILGILVWFSALFSIGTLLFAYFAAKKITNSIWIQSFIVGLLSFTPAFVYQAGMIGNDPLAAVLSAGAFFFLICYLKEDRIKYIILSVLLAVLATSAKISSGMVILTILFGIILKYRETHRKDVLITAYFIFLIGFLYFGSALYRAYIPSTGEFRFVESYAYAGQITNPSDPSYFLSFALSDLTKEGQSYVWGNKNIVQSFPTFLYGSFLFGEYSYDQITNVLPLMKVLMQLIILLGLLFPIGIIVNSFYIKKWGVIEYVSASGVVINLALIILFLFRYPSVANSDFRYFAPTFLPLLILSGTGLFRLSEKITKLKFIIPALCFSLIFFEFIWITGRIAIKIFTNI